jgi:hypothetical protein
MGRVDLRLMVTLLDVGSATGFIDPARVGVSGGCRSPSSSSSPSSGVAESRTAAPTLAASTDLLRDPPLDIRCRFLEECTSSSKGFGRVEQGSEETARSRVNSGDSTSIWQERCSDQCL